MARSFSVRCWIYLIRTNVALATLSPANTVLSYKRLTDVERAFRCLKTVDLKLRPIHHHLPDRVRAHVFICVLAYYVEWHMRRALAPMLFEDDDRPSAARQRGRRCQGAAIRQSPAQGTNQARRRRIPGSQLPDSS